MDEDMSLDLEALDGDIEKSNKVEERIRNLSAREKEARAEAEASAKARAELETQKAEVERERDFYSSFADVASKYPGAAEYKDAILEKVKAGYAVDDAAAAVLVKEGKIGAQSATVKKPESPAGGSAVNQITDNAEKSVAEMSRDEKRAALEEIFSKGDLGLS